MSGNTPIELVHARVAAEHANGILCYVLGLEEMCRRVNVVAIRYNQGNPAVPGIYQAFVASCYREGDRPPLLPLVPGAISLYAGPEAPSGPSRFAHKYASNTNQLYYIIDVAGYDTSFIVPLGRYVPYIDKAPGRAAIVLDNIEPVPLWVVSSGGGLGVPVGGSDIQFLQHGDREFTNADGKAKTTVYVRIEWPGYIDEPKWQAQIRMANDPKRPGPDSYTFRRLVNQVRGKVRKFISDHAEVATQIPHWAVGSAHGRITADDLELLAIVIVSQGAVMPILKLRDNFEFAASTIQAGQVVSNMATLNDYQGAYLSAAAGPSVPYEPVYFNGTNITEADQFSNADQHSYASHSSYATHSSYASASSHAGQYLYNSQSSGSWQSQASYNAYGSHSYY